MGMLITVAAAWIVTASLLVPQADMLLKARDAICGGDVRRLDSSLLRACDLLCRLPPPRLDASALHVRTSTRQVHFVFTASGLQGGRTWARTPPPYNFSTGASASYPLDLVGATSFGDSITDGVLNGAFDRSRCPVCYMGVANASLWSEPNYTMPQDSCCIGMQMRMGTIRSGWMSLKDQSLLTTASASNLYNQLCLDVLDPSLAGDTVNIFRGAVGDAFDPAPCGGNCTKTLPMCRPEDGVCVVPRCFELYAYCHESSERGVTIRMLCPQTCGCDDPLSPLVLSTTESGCSPGCAQRIADARAAAPCMDHSHLPGTSLGKYLDSLPQIIQTWPLAFATSMQEELADLRLFGCGYLTASQFFWGHPPLLCTNLQDGLMAYPVGSLESLCAVSCQTCSPNNDQPRALPPPCVDAVLAPGSLLDRYLDSVPNITSTWPASWRGINLVEDKAVLLETYLPNLRRDGCPYLAFLAVTYGGADLCSGHLSAFVPMSVYCPASCGMCAAAGAAVPVGDAGSGITA